MINGVKMSEIQQITKNKTSHLKRLDKINRSRSKKYQLSNNSLKIIETIRANHENRRIFNRQQQQIILYKQNQKLYDKLMDLSMEEGPYSVQSNLRKTNYLHHNHKVENIKKCKMIDDQNPELARRIMEKTGYLNHEKDLENFRKTRKIAHRLQKFETVTRMVQFRSKTLPSRKIKTQKSLQNNKQIGNSKRQNTIQ